jgi:lipid-A-disaccharide synthase
VSRPRIFLSAGEPSGDLHGARLAEALRRRFPDAELFGLGGDRMKAAGVELLAHVDQLAVMGFVEVLRHLPYFVGLMRRVRAELARRHTDLVIPIDYPGFNLRLARHAHGAAIPVLYYIAPQVWAWHRSRVAQLARHTDRIAVILPFEEELFRAAGAHAEFVGHPLAEQPAPTAERDVWLRGVGVDPARPVLALFPGSRAQEVKRHLDVFTAAAHAVQARLPGVQPVVAANADLPREAYRGVPYPLTDDGWTLLHHARAALVKSGTSTLQAALAGTPLVVTYRVHPVTFRLAQRLVRVPHIGLVNLVAGERVAPELLQHDATPGRLAAALLPLLDATEPPSPERARALAGLARVRAALRPEPGAPSASELVARLAAGLVAR